MAKIGKESIYNLLFKITGIILSFLHIKLLLNYFGQSDYGLWITIYSIVSWLEIGDFGIGNSLRNEVSKAIAHGENGKIKRMLISSVKTLTYKLWIILLVYFIILCFLERYGIISDNLLLPVVVLSLFQIISIFVKVTHSILYGMQRSWMITASTACTSMSSVIITYILIELEIPVNFLSYSVLYGSVNLFWPIILCVCVWVFICNENNSIYEDDGEKKELNHNSIRFFVLQVTSLVLFSTDYLLIEYIGKSEDVANYSVINQIYNLGGTLFATALIPIWSSISYHFILKNKKEILNIINKYIALWGGFCVGVLFVSVGFNSFIKIWLGDKGFIYSNYTIIFFALYVIFDGLQAIFSNVMNGTGQNRVQMVAGIISAIVNIPLSFYFAKKIGMGIWGVKFATLVCLVPSWLVVIIWTLVMINRLDDTEYEQ